MSRAIKPGLRVRLARDVDRYPHFIARAGATGTVTEIGDVVRVHMDEPIEGCEEWDNDIEWCAAAGDDAASDLEALPMLNRRDTAELHCDMCGDTNRPDLQEWNGFPVSKEGGPLPLVCGGCRAFLVRLCEAMEDREWVPDDDPNDQ